MNFVPETSRSSVEVPYYEEASKEAGWQGQATEKGLETLKSEITTAISRLGGLVTGFQRGKFATGKLNRDGFRIGYLIETSGGEMIRRRIDIAALPVKEEVTMRRSLDTRREKSLKMSLYMLRIALDGTWFLQQLSPGYAPLMPWMLAEGDKTVSQLWSESAVMSRLLPPGESDFVEGVYRE